MPKRDGGASARFPGSRAINTLLMADISYFDEDLLKNQSTLMFTFTSGRLDNSSVRSANTCWASAVASEVSVSSEKHKKPQNSQLFPNFKLLKNYVDTNLCR